MIVNLNLTEPAPAGLDALTGGGEMGRLLRAFDWAATPLGSPGTWSQALRMTMRLLLTSRHPMCVFWGEERTWLYNDAYREATRTERHPSMLGQPGRRAWGDVWAIIGPQVEQVMAGGEATWNEEQLVAVTRQGRSQDFWWTYGCSPIADAAAPGRIGGVLVICNDVTRPRLAREALRVAEERTRLALSASGGVVGTWDWDVPADRAYADQQFACLHGVDPDRARAGAPLAEFMRNIHPADIEEVHRSFAHALSTGEDHVAEYRLIQPGGAVRWVTVRGRCLRAEHGVAMRFPGVSIDITERKQGEQQLRLLNAELERQVIERSHERGRTWQVSADLLAVLDANGYFERSNPAWLSVLGWTEAEVGRISVFQFVHPDDRDRLNGAFDALRCNIPVLRFESRFRCKDGSYRHLWWTAVLEGEKVYCSARDITSDKAREAEMEQMQEALRQSQKMEAVGQLTGGLAHDFNNLLAGISGSLELLQTRVGQGRFNDLERYIAAAQGAAKRAAALTHRLLAFTRRQTLDPKATDVNRLVAGMEELVRRTMGPSIETEVTGAAGLWTTFVDPNQLENALLNLCLNARDAMPDGGRLVIAIANDMPDERVARLRHLSPGQYVVLSVTDDGTGMAPEVARRAFDPFFTTKPIGMGTGLGLSMIYGFVQQSGGQARIASEVGKGTTVSLYLPRHHGPPEASDRPAELAEAPRAGQGETVLVVDDEPTVRMLVTEVLAELGYIAIEAADGAAGLRVLRSDARVDLLVTDVGLPGGINGRQVADGGRAVRPGLKVLFITGYAESAVLSHGHLEAGMHVMTKPFAMEALATRIRGLIGDGAALAADHRRALAEAPTPGMPLATAP